MTQDEFTMDLHEHLGPDSDADQVLERRVARPLRERRPDVSETLLEILGELLDNALTHGDSRAGTDLSLRVEPQTVHLRIADHGIGIRAHLSRAGVLSDTDAVAIELAVRPGTTGAHEPRGYGLADSIAALVGLPAASLSISSGNGRGIFAPPAPPTFEQLTATIEGTMAELQVGSS